MAYFELKRSKDKQFVFTLVADNGEVVLNSETYRRKSGAKKGIAAVAREAGTAAIRDLTKTKAKDRLLPIPHTIKSPPTSLA